jgi:ATP-binding cassette subfamily F protein 3
VIGAGAGKDQRIERVLNGLGFSREDHNRSCAEFSGGWQMRVALGRLLLSEPELLLLDEPTNHLDLKAKRWLMAYLASYEGTIVIVSHEEALLEAAECTAIAEIRDKKVHYFRCAYPKYLVERQERVERSKREYEAQQKEIAHLQSYIDRFGAKANLAASAQSRKKKIDKMQVLEAPDDLQKGKRPKLVLPEPPKCRFEMVTLAGASIGWGGGDEADDKSLMFKALDLRYKASCIRLGPHV